MKSPLTVSVLVWMCNILLAVLVVSITLGIFYYTKIPGLISIDRDLEGVNKASFRVSQSFLSDDFIFERNIDREKGIDEAKYYLAAFFWYLRKFVTGLRKPAFFTKENARYLYITAFFVLFAPILMWIWHRFLRPDLFADLEFTGATAVAGGSELSAALFIFGFLLFVIAWCFNHGVNLQKEQELTI